jgi:hypothetical protein
MRRHVGLESDTAALRLSLPFRLLALCLPLSFPPSFTPFLLHSSLLFPFTFFLCPLLFLLNPFPILIPFM